jgi:8-oxo-dGTP pyrophosphatase MutT (NUDIX family)
MDIRKCFSNPHSNNASNDLNAAVNIILFKDKELKTLLIKRKNDPADPWSGDVAFPGGKVDPQDNSLIDTALRETEEEVGIHKINLEVIGFLEPEEPRNIKGIKVLPVVSILKIKQTKIVLGSEAVKAFWIPLNQANIIIEQFNHKGKYIEAYLYNNEIIWGLTKRILDKVLERLKECNAIK